jgi:hypothetical protein
MRQRILENLPRNVADSDALSPVDRERFLVYVMGPYRTFDVETLLPDDADPADDTLPSFATWNDRSSTYAEDDVLRLLQETRDCLRHRGFNAFLAIDVGIELNAMDAATQSIEFARASNATVFVAPAVGDNLGVGIEIGSVLEDILSAESGDDSATAGSQRRADRFMVATEPDVQSAMLGAVHTRWDGSVRTFDDADDLCRLCAQFCTHIQNEEVYGDLPQLD